MPETSISVHRGLLCPALECSVYVFAAFTFTFMSAPAHQARHTHASKDGRHISTVKKYPRSRPVKKYPRSRPSVSQAVSAGPSLSGPRDQFRSAWLQSSRKYTHLPPVLIACLVIWLCMARVVCLPASALSLGGYRNAFRTFPSFRQEASASASCLQAGRLLWLLLLSVCVA